MRRTEQTTAPSQRSSRKPSKARTPEGRENQLINLAIDLAEKQLRDGSASSQVITHFLKLATVKEQLENEKLRADLRVAEAKIDNYKSQADIKGLYEKAINAMKEYAGFGTVEEEEYEE